MIEFAPRRRRLEDVRLTDFPNTLTMASLERELQRRVDVGCDPAEQLLNLAQGVQNWLRIDQPAAAPGDVVTVSLGGGGNGYAYRATYACRVGDRVRVPGIAGETIGEVVALESDYAGAVKAMYGRAAQ